MNTLAIVDDDEIAQILIKEMVEKHQLANEIILFSDVETAIDYLGKITDENNIPDVLFLDINLPGLDGWDFLVEYEGIKPHLSKSMIIYMLSSSISNSDMVRAESNSNVKGYISKPLTLDKLQNLISAE